MWRKNRFCFMLRGQLYLYMNVVFEIWQYQKHSVNV